MIKLYAKKLLLLPILSFLFVKNVKAQANAYSFSQSTGTYSEITGGTVLNTGTWDDNNYTAVPIGFSFTFNGVAYTTLRVNSNGFLFFGTTSPSSATYSPISGTSTYPGCVSALGNDMLAASGTSTIRYQTLGTAPSQTFVLQWKNAARYNASAAGGINSGDDFNFQIQLNESTNTINIVYGSCTITSFSSTAQVGLRGAANTDYNNRLTSTNWSATTAGAANNASCTLSSTVVPANGLTFTYAPPQPCTSSFVGGTTVSSIGTQACSGSGFTLSVNGATSASGFTYQWETSANGTDWANASGTSNAATYAVTNFTTATYYRRKMTCSGTDQYSSVVQITLASALNYASIPYVQDFENWITSCNGTTSYANGIPSAEWRNTILTNDSSWRRNDQGFATSAWQYSGDEPAPFPAPFSSTGTYSARFHTYGTSASRRGTLLLHLNCSSVTSPLQLSFDYRNPTGNDTLVFSYSTDNGASFTRVNVLGTSSAWSNKSFVFNSTSSQTIIRLQAFSDFGNDDIGIDNLKVELAPACLSPTGLSISGISGGNANFSWNTTVGATDYEVVVKTTAANPTTAGTSTSGANSYSFTGLALNTTYFAFVRANCGTGGLGSWVSTQFSTTPNDECANAITINQQLNGTTCTATNVSTAAATQSAQTAPSCSGGFGFEDDVWYKFVATKTSAIIRISNLNVLSGTSTDVGSIVYSGTCGSLTEVASSCTVGNATSLTLERTVNGLTIGQTYYIRVYGGGAANNEVTFNMCVLEPPAPPANDECVNATTVSAGGGTINVTTVSATQSIAPILCNSFTSTGAGDIWFKFTTLQAGSVTITTSGLDVVIEAFSGTCGSLTSLSCADVSGTTETLTLTGLAATTTYYFRVYGYGSVTAAQGTFTLSITGTALPVTITSFKGERKGTENLLSWTTATETNNAGFELQRSADGVNFSPMIFVNSKAPNGNSTQALNYNFTDVKPLSGSGYYRLKQVDKDGKSSFSEVVLIKGLKPTKLELVSVYPNPVVNTLKVSIAAAKADKVTFIVSDITGKAIVTQVVNVISGDNTLQLDVNNLAKGTYTIKAICADGCETAIRKFVKQ